VKAHRVSAETWALLDRCQRQVLPGHAYATPKEPTIEQAEEPEMSPEQAKALDEAFEARQRSQRKIREMKKRRAVPRANCGHGRIKHLRKTLSGDVTDALLRPKCGRHDCQVCWRYRLTQTITRAVKTLLYRVDGNVRIDKVFLQEIAWEDWSSLNLSLRRRHTKTCGRLHLRLKDDRCLVVCAKPFKGAEAMSTGQVVGRFLDLAETMHTDRHSFRLLGEWADKKKSIWKQVGEYASHDLEPIKEALQEEGKKASWAFERRPEIHQGLLWRCSSEEEAEALFARLRAKCRFLDIEDDGPLWPNCDTEPAWPWDAPECPPEHVEPPFDTAPTWECF
jgi:hypothetical protein